ncbi:hypothetical protein RB195_014371 [Necator americanus]|uniref:SXP/RAL-2 family protein Ani s 5-like cation-binding domain-containing protein n=1 Tax=Necator americanus TaxID=51031 RepID=A0ABR1E070_NECAM
MKGRKGKEAKVLIVDLINYGKCNRLNLIWQKQKKENQYCENLKGERNFTFALLISFVLRRISKSLRNLLFLSLPLVVISQQYSTQRANVDTVPAWYQGHPKQMNPGYGYERVQGASQANMNYHNYPTFGANRPAYPELTMGGVAPTRRYPVGGQDPNAELLAAIKDVVAKFKASLDETGIDQDVRLMGSQLRNTWQQLRTGLDRGLRAVKQSAENSLAQTNIGMQHSIFVSLAQ